MSKIVTISFLRCWVFLPLYSLRQGGVSGKRRRERVARHNLPAATTPFIGRVKELNKGGDAARAARVFRPDVYRRALIGTGDPLPGASSKVEGSLTGPTSVAMQQGIITMERNTFFDGKIFDPSHLAEYVDGQRTT